MELEKFREMKPNMSKKCMINLDSKTNEMKDALLTIDGWNFSFHTREMVRYEYAKAVQDGKLVPLEGKVNDQFNK